jgi:guanylate kinase
VTPRIVIVSAPSGGGKTVVTQELCKRHPDLFGYSVSATTRQPRPGEQDGQAYHFLTRTEFERRRKAGEFLETADYAGELYGTLKSEVDSVLAKGLNVLLDIEVKGARQVRGQYPEAIAIFLLPPSADVLLERLRGRRTESIESLERRIKIAQEEVEVARRDIQGAAVYDHLVVNEDLNRTVDAVLAIVEHPGRVRHRTGEMLVHLEKLMFGLQTEAQKLYDELRESK